MAKKKAKRNNGSGSESDAQSISDVQSESDTEISKSKFKDDKLIMLQSEKENSEPEEGEVSDSSDSSEEEFNDGYDDQLMGDEEDRSRLASLTEKERETELFKRIEQRELMKTRYV